MARIIIHLSGGVFRHAISDSPDIELMLVDHDNIDAGDKPPSEFQPIEVAESRFLDLLAESSR